MYDERGASEATRCKLALQAAAERRGLALEVRAQVLRKPRLMGLSLCILTCRIQHVFDNGVADGGADGGAGEDASGGKPTAPVAVGDKVDIALRGEAGVVCGSALPQRAALLDRMARGRFDGGEKLDIVRCRCTFFQRNRKGRAILRLDDVLETSYRPLSAPPPKLAPNAERHRLFAKWLVETFGRDRLRIVLDVAGGRGELAEYLRRDWNLTCIVVDPKAGDCNLTCIADPKADASLAGLEGEAAARVFRVAACFDAALLGGGGETALLLRTATFVVGLHPDEATDAVIDAALELGVPFAVVPCCVFPKLFHARRRRAADAARPGGFAEKAVVAKEDLLQYLQQKAGEGAAVSQMPFVGRNDVVHSDPRRWTDPPAAPPEA
ncbi:hypothetical protein M885DRAFT_509290 [Pelagophyceae sp. CCMP2097]|nr:hypothetical protein M885DRAFT_509290 [Pelagophyceae sp. CCMP2097]|mmetsp:Transcript_3305/g.11970  ORF Transcript_3305/g.11970 Transcript_3305/m.11970 type:complete len:382 (-) Transcript_3305:823-1968(-)